MCESCLMDAQPKFKRNSYTDIDRNVNLFHRTKIVKLVIKQVIRVMVKQKSTQS